MAFSWDKLFSERLFITLTNEERRYFGLDPIGDDWEITCFYSKINITYVRTTVYWSKDEIRKVIVEDNRLLDGEERPVSRYIDEYDTRLKTEGRKMLLPLTARGKPKPVTAANIRAATPFGCSFHFGIEYRSNHVHLAVFNPRNDYQLPIGEEKRIEQIGNEEDFHAFMDYYMQSCPADYFGRVAYMRTAKHQTVKYKTGDIFRIELDRFRYSYGVITGQVRKIRKWPELPEFHSLQKLMAVPIMIRYYELVTERSNLTVQELAAYPLSRLSICCDNDIIWGRHKIIGHKDITAEDIEFHLICTRIWNGDPDPHSTVHTYQFMLNEGFVKKPYTYRLYVEWGTAATSLPYEQISAKMREYAEGYLGSGGEHLSIDPDRDNKWYDSRENLLNPDNLDIKQELFRCLGLEPDADFDDFARKFGGLTKAEIMKKDF